MQSCCTCMQTQQAVHARCIKRRVASVIILQGEGETKILKRINSSPKGSHVIIGNDSDIILMSLMCPVKRLHILAQQTQGKSNRYTCLSLDALDLPAKQTEKELETAHALVCLRCAALCCAVLCCAVLCCAVLCCAALRSAVLCCAVQAVSWPSNFLPAITHNLTCFMCMAFINCSTC